MNTKFKVGQLVLARYNTKSQPQLAKVKADFFKDGRELVLVHFDKGFPVTLPAELVKP